MKKLIKNILKENFNPEDFDWVRKIDPMDSFVEWAESLRSTHYGFQDESDNDWLKLIEDTKSFIEEFTDETHTLLEMVENLNSSAGLQHTSDMLVNIQDYLGDSEEQYDDFYVDLYRTDSKKLWKFLKNFKSYGDKYDLTLEQLLNLSHKYFERQVYGDKENSESLKEYNDREKSLLHEAADHFAEGLRLIESATQFAYEENNEDLIRDLEKLRMSIQSGGDKMWAERPNSMNIVNRINDIIEKYS
jgi:hypothetical protein